MPVDGQQFDAHEIIPPENHESVFNVSSLSVESAITLTVDEDVLTIFVFVLMVLLLVLFFIRSGIYRTFCGGHGR